MPNHNDQRNFQVFDLDFTYSRKGNRCGSSSLAASKSSSFAMHHTISCVHVVPESNKRRVSRKVISSQFTAFVSIIKGKRTKPLSQKLDCCIIAMTLILPEKFSIDIFSGCLNSTAVSRRGYLFSGN